MYASKPSPIIEVVNNVTDFLQRNSGGVIQCSFVQNEFKAIGEASELCIKLESREVTIVNMPELIYLAISVSQSKGIFNYLSNVVKAHN